jgi:hypothetical protein
MRRLGLAIGAITLIATQALAIQAIAQVSAAQVSAAQVSAAQDSTTQVSATDARFEKSLERLDPIDRLEQLCDYTAMAAIRKDDRNYQPDRAVANAMVDANVAENSIKATAGAFRSRGKWYTLAYDCTATPDHLKVVKFHYTIGSEIPETKWAGYGLWD